MQDYLSIFAISFTVALSGALMPGPLLATVIAESAGAGFWPGPLISLGHALLEGALVALIAAGLAGFLKSGYVMAAAAAAGSAFLLYSGLKMLSSLGTLTLSAAKKRAGSPGRLIAAGAIVSATNPYWIVWWMTVGLGFAISASGLGAAGVIVFFCGHILADVLWYSLVSLVIARRKSFLSDRSYKTLLCVCALTLVGFGVLFLLRIPSAFRR